MKNYNLFPKDKSLESIWIDEAQKEAGQKRYEREIRNYYPDLSIDKNYKIVKEN